MKPAVLALALATTLGAPGPVFGTRVLMAQTPAPTANSKLETHNSQLDRNLSTDPLTTIRRRGTLLCGLNQSEAEYNPADQHGPRVAFDTDLCRAVAAAILGPQAHYAIKGYPDNDTALDALRAGEVDLVPSVSDDFTHATQPGILLTQPVLYDAIGILVPTAAHITTLAQLSSQRICYLAETETETQLHTYFDTHHLTLVPYPFSEQGEMEAAFSTHNCSALAGDLTRLATVRLSLGSHAPDYELLPETLAPDTLAMASRSGTSEDLQLRNILTWTLNLLIAAEEHNITRANLAAATKSQDPTLRRLLGLTRELGRPLGLDDAWPQHVIEATGNYGELYDRDLGPNSPLKLPRGQNALARNGGLLQSLPLQ
ncbi:amino acid ABC transporter substrate-binding protein, PAAT family [Bryocella elongata]|uniref:Amino acid ABC transporter substrate-binding protein, PAAT family n=1 Tax=Bryocella elongata TaxID=863522 RepID=A0A1H5SJH1_9BACT|nr:transporter substrate-binding domain-containing protein [Bryocella elongata]SEF50783.1 amino acid ABC transporter substrate-binding protein, PAAT family [Bryocella elongata]